ncbi:MAG: cbb3-type cytochrome c oxidase subunit I, partial [Luteimonas sp.]
RVPMLHIIGFFITFVCGGLTGVMLAFVPFDWQAHDTHFVVAHLHYVLIGGMMFPMFAGLYYWLPLASGRMPSESLSRSGFWLVFIGFNLTFLPMHITGLVGMPRRVDSYAMELGVQWLNLLSTAAGFVLAVGIVAILIDVALCFRLGRRGVDNPWQAGTLEWALPSPVPMYNFASMPVVGDRYPLWHAPGIAQDVRRTDGLLGEAHDGRREILGTGIQSAQPEQVIRVSHSTWLPLFAALSISVLLAGFITSQYWLSVLMLVPLIGLFLRWVWTTGDRHAPLEIEVAPGLRLPTQASARNAPGWWALVGTLLIDGSLFASLVFAYFYLWLNAPAWPAGGAAPTAWTPMLIALGALLAAGVAAWRMPAVLRRGRTRAAIGWSVAAIAFGIVALAVQLPELARTVGVPQAHAYGSVVWTLAGFHAVHVVVALLIGGFVALRIHRGHVDGVRCLEARIATGFWRYVVAQGAIAWALLHLFPRFA